MARLIVTLALVAGAAGLLYGIRYDTQHQQVVMQLTLDKMCPMVWAHRDQLRSLSVYDEAIKWCPET